MKPGDHPEFFRLPPPEGRSRESTIVLSSEGRFFHDGAAVEHPGMQRAFASYLTVEGAARFVQAVREEAGRPLLVLLDGGELPLDPTALRVDASGRFSVVLAEGEPACFTARAQLELSPWLVERAGQIGVQIQDAFSPVEGATTQAARP